MAPPLALPQTIETQRCVKTRMLHADDIFELYLTAIPPKGLPPHEQAAVLFEEIARELETHDAHLLDERIFAAAGVADELRASRAHAYGPRDDGVSPTWLISPGGETEIQGVQVHAVAGCGRPRVLSLDGEACGRVVDCRHGQWTTLSALGGQKEESPQAQYATAFAKAQRLLRQAGMDFRSVVRTWWWMRDILDHYAIFNQVRREFFRSAGVGVRSGAGAETAIFSPPASTGIGVAPMDGTFCALDVTAFRGDSSRTEFYAAAGNQRSAFEYGSAFSRAAHIDALAGRSMFVSGTADIDPEGRTCHIDDAEAQILATLRNVAAVLDNVKGSMRDIVQAMAYCKTPQVERIWRSMPAARRLPVVTILGDVCRDDLLFEMEATALVDNSIEEVAYFQI
ncbi:MAG TPA: hypothetical protein VKX17_20320 [Planctomycetota bacterium]|nr:hypothetical protein [Planctomycetota bacterium]